METFNKTYFIGFIYLAMMNMQVIVAIKNMYMHVMCLCVCVQTQNYFKYLFSFCFNLPTYCILILSKPLHFQTVLSALPVIMRWTTTTVTDGLKIDGVPKVSVSARRGFSTIVEFVSPCLSHLVEVKVKRINIPTQ